MAATVRSNLMLINAPAGSGKTTRIQSMVEQLVLEKLDRKILCITYTNRAAEELKSRIQANTVQVMTIHSFFSEFMKPYFSNSKIVEEFFNIYKKQIENNILEDCEKGAESRRGQRYIDVYGELNFETIKKNVHQISYNELQYNSLYYGGLCHDDLLSFSFDLEEKFPMIKLRLCKSYSHIFIDEYQDTSSNVLFFFYNAVKDSETKLYLFGDRMQQIYDKYDGSFEEKFKEFRTDLKLSTNHRSTRPIITVLNNLYNNEFFKQEVPEDKEFKETDIPCVFITDDIERIMQKEQEKINQKVLKLYVTNRERYEKIGAGNLFRSITSIKDQNGNQKYGFNKRYSETDVLGNDLEDNPEPLFRILFSIDQLLKFYEDGNYGKVIQMIKNKENGKDKFFNTGNLSVKHHSDKIALSKQLNLLAERYSSNSNISIKEFIEFGITHKVLKENIKEIIGEDGYAEILEVKVSEVYQLCRNNDSPECSTQHGVKGEGYDNVFFIVEDNNNLKIKITEFLNMRAEIGVEFQSLQSFYYEFSKAITEIEDRVGKDYKKSATEYDKVRDKVIPVIEEIDNAFRGNKYYIYLYREFYESYISNDNCARLKKYTNINLLKGILNAYKLFYVGCSRAKKKLRIFISREQISSKEEMIAEMFKKDGFLVKR